MLQPSREDYDHTSIWEVTKAHLRSAGTVLFYMVGFFVLLVVAGVRAITGSGTTDKEM